MARIEYQVIAEGAHQSPRLLASSAEAFAIVDQWERAGYAGRTLRVVEYIDLTRTRTWYVRDGRIVHAEATEAAGRQ